MRPKPQAAWWREIPPDIPARPTSSEHAEEPPEAGKLMERRFQPIMQKFEASWKLYTAGGGKRA